MKNIYTLIFAVLSVILLATSCSPDEPQLGGTISKDQLKFSITQNPDDPNMVILESLTPNATPYWTTPLGRSTRVKDTVRIAFPGTYTFTYGVLSEGGATDADPFVLTLTTSNLTYVDDPLWANLTGGVGKEKVWRLDYGTYGLNAGPLTYCEPQTTWTEWQAGTAKVGWAPAWIDNQWIIEEADKNSRMTFSLKGGAYMKTHKVTEGVDESGTFFLDVNNHTLTTTDATILRSKNFIANATNWNKNLVVLSLTENQLMVGVRRTNSEGDYLYVWNFVSDTYAENYVPEETGDPNFDFGDQTEILAVNTSKTWVLDPQVPFNWADLNGKLLNEWNSRADIIAAGWTGYDDSSVANIDGCSITFTKDGKVTVRQDNGTETHGTYTNTESTNTITFKDVTPTFIIAGWISVATTEENQWKIVKVESDVAGSVTGIWFGKRDPAKAEYMVFHFLSK